MLINSGTAIAGAIIGLLLFFLQFKEFELYWGVFYSCEAVSLAKLYCGALGFLRLEEEYWFSLGLFTTRRGVLVFSRFFFTGSRFVHAAF